MLQDANQGDIAPDAELEKTTDESDKAPVPTPDPTNAPSEPVPEKRNDDGPWKFLS